MLTGDWEKILGGYLGPAGLMMDGNDPVLLRAKKTAEEKEIPLNDDEMEYYAGVNDTALPGPGLYLGYRFYFPPDEALHLIQWQPKGCLFYKKVNYAFLEKWFIARGNIHISPDVYPIVVRDLEYTAPPEYDHDYDDYDEDQRDLCLAADGYYEAMGEWRGRNAEKAVQAKRRKELMLCETRETASIIEYASNAKIEFFDRLESRGAWTERNAEENEE